MDEKSRTDLHSIAIAVLSIGRAIGMDEEARKLLLVPAVTKRLLSLPRKVMTEIGTPDHPSTRQAQRAQMAVLLELLLHLPMRIRNAAELAVGETIMPPLAGIQG